jgi:hypothetical protein
MSVEDTKKNQDLTDLVSGTQKSNAIPEVINETPRFGVGSLKRVPPSIEVDIRLLREAHQEHGRMLGQILNSITRLERCYSVITTRVDSIVELLSKAKIGGK